MARKTAREYAEEVRLRSYGTFDGCTVVTDRIEQVILRVMLDTVADASLHSSCVSRTEHTTEIGNLETQLFAKDDQWWQAWSAMWYSIGQAHFIAWELEQSTKYGQGVVVSWNKREKEHMEDILRRSKRHYDVLQERNVLRAKLAKAIEGIEHIKKNALWGVEQNCDAVIAFLKSE